MTNLQWLQSLRPAIPFGAEKPCTQMSNGELRRQAKQGGILINGQRFDPDAPFAGDVVSLVFFPRSPARRTTLF